VPDSKLLEESRLQAEEHHEAMVALQEELDWKSYQIFGITQQGFTCTEGVIPGIRFGERAFELVMARRMDAGDIEGNWFDRHGVTPRLEFRPRRTMIPGTTNVQRTGNFAENSIFPKSGSSPSRFANATPIPRQ